MTWERNTTSSGDMRDIADIRMSLFLFFYFAYFPEKYDMLSSRSASRELFLRFPYPDTRRFATSLCDPCWKTHLLDLKYFYSCHWLALILRESIFLPNPFIVVEWIAGERKNGWMPPHVRCGAPARRGGCGNPDAQFQALFICVYLRLFVFIYVYIHQLYR
jgi:hypothetical protein